MTRPATSGAMRIRYACTTACDDEGVSRSMTIDKANSRMVAATTMSAALRSGFAEAVSAGAGFAGVRSSTASLLVVSDSLVIEATRVWQPEHRCQLPGVRGVPTATVAFCGIPIGGLWPALSAALSHPLKEQHVADGQDHRPHKQAEKAVGNHA